MSQISHQYSPHVEFTQHGKLIDERIATLLDALAAYELPKPLETTGLRLSVTDGRLEAVVLGFTLLATAGHALISGRLVGSVTFSQLRDYRLNRRNEGPLGEPLFRVALDPNGDVGAALHDRQFGWVATLNNESEKNDFCRQVCIALVDVATGLLGEFEI